MSRKKQELKQAEVNKAPESSGTLVNLVLTALMAALIFVVTYLLSFRMPGTNNGYVNLGDLIIFLTAVLLGNPWAGIAAALGSGLADFIGGYPQYIIPTVIIKGMMGFLVSNFTKSGSPALFKLSTFISGIIMCGGYFTYEIFLYRAGDTLGWIAAVDGLPLNIAQAVSCMLLSWVLFKPAMSLKNRLTPQ